MEELRKQALECDFVRFTWADFHGIARGRYVPKISVEQVLKDGIGMFCGLITFGPRSQYILFEKTKDLGNSTSFAMPDTFHVLPWAGEGEYKIGEVLCETFWSPGEQQEACPRYVARKQVENLTSSHGLTLVSGWEEEFMLINKDTKELLFDGCDYASHLLFNEHAKFYLDLQTMLGETGVELEGIHTEFSPGQIELVTRPVVGMRGVDAAFNFKEAVKEISSQRGLQALFMAKPYPDKTGSGLHFNFSFKNEKGANVFADETGKNNLSDFARFFIGGLISHAKAIAALCCPTVNCYRRLHNPFAPGKITWGVDKRLAYLRVKFGSSGPYMENRVPSAAANPYLVTAANLAAGMDGVAKQMEPPPEMEEAADDFPHSLQEALKALEDDTVLTEALGAEFVEWFIAVKRDIECKELKDSDMNKPTPDDMKKEHEMYAKFI